ncbi:sigma-70 family RNA polymerase sigma factor [Sphingobium sp. HBC34]|uniref:Sigma-70 family RNA polymerase sigma factor n=1 Tax=Sphingobium cyanobacteriorum TaxID=3063954 RepID=A0ABT8ZSL6_9SPHN|nr:sigma-70 family RNA polymerase sigma factor [Sphingobium sp. HBC34]MDO7837202.1 sigma-70 family RNA polymerase sigma factor [Sphingobium sp. HBC34]
MEQLTQPHSDFASADPVFIARVREDMLRFARQQLGNDDEAEDAVQEALAGALKNSDNFRGEAALKTWIIAILKNKIADILRQRQRRPINASQLTTEELDGPLPAVFDQKGMWRDATRPARWEDPEADLHSRQFLAVFDACLGRLPPQQGRVFLMREVVELDTPEICSELGLSVSNVHVILHRARLGLRACLQVHWLQEEAR